MPNDARFMASYHALLKAYGSQGWWPVAGRHGGKPEYKQRKRLTGRQKLEIMIGAILTQNTSWKNVEKVMVQLHSRKLIDDKKMLVVSHKKLAALIRSSGYHNQKAIKLKHMAQFLQQHPLRQLGQMDVEKVRILLLDVHGIGPETADSIILYALQKPSFVIDTYTKRIFSRIGMCREDVKYDLLRMQFMDNLPHDTILFNGYHSLLVEHAKQHCRKMPLCEGCPLLKQCDYGRKKQKESVSGR